MIAKLLNVVIIMIVLKAMNVEIIFVKLYVNVLSGKTLIVESHHVQAIR